MNFSLSDWVVWDTSFLSRFYDHVVSSVGSAVSVGILIFAVVFGIGLVVGIIRLFRRV